MFFLLPKKYPIKFYTYLLILVSKLEFPDQHRSLPILIRANTFNEDSSSSRKLFGFRRWKDVYSTTFTFSVFGNLEIIKLMILFSVLNESYYSSEISSVMMKFHRPTK